MIEVLDMRNATEEEIRKYEKKCRELDQQTEEHPDLQPPEWQQRMMDNFLRRPKCHPDCFGAASNDCGRCSGWNAKIKESENGSKSWR